MTWRASFLDELKESRVGDSIEVSTTRDNDEPLVQPAGAPARFAAVRLLQISGHKSWTEISKLLFPLFDRASELSRTSPLQAEIARIRTAAPDPKTRTEAALRLVQDQIRYVYLGMNDARIVPADVETTWSRRFGDCKAKTALHIALLRELGIEAEPVAVSSVAGDALPTRLPMIEMFNHVLVRATLAGKTYWLDGARSGDRKLDDLPIPNYRWGLPLTATGADLVKIEAVPLSTPTSETTITVDATAGAEAPASFRAETLLRADAATVTQRQISSLTEQQRDAALRAYWTRQPYWSNNWSDVALREVKAEFDDTNAILRVSMAGQGIMNWHGDQHLIGSVNIGDYVDLKREPGPNSDAPYLTAFPTYTHIIERIKLPHDGAGFEIVGSDVDRTVAGVHYQRNAQINTGELVAEASVRSVTAEFPASEAPAAQKALRELWDDPVYAKLPSNPLVGSGPVPVSLASLDLSMRSFGGVTLGMTPSQVEHVKGAPVKRMDPHHWVYNSIDSAHDGLLDVFFGDNPDEELRDVRMVVFSGKPEAVPRGFPNLFGRKRQYLVRQFGEPVSETSAGPDGQYLYFGNGICALLHSGTTISYGVYAPPR